MRDQSSVLMTLAGALVVAAFTALFAYFRYVQEQNHQRRTLLNALFAELANVLEHYTYAAAEFPRTAPDAFELRKRIRWSKYGALRSANDIGKMGFLDAPSIKALLQLELRIRNDAILLDQLLEDVTNASCTPSNLRETKGRLADRVADADWLLNQLVEKRPELRKVLAEVRDGLPVDFGA